MSTTTLPANRKPQAFLNSRGVKSAPVTVVDDEIIIGYFPKKLIATLKLDTQVDLSGRTGWLAEKYDKILRATIRVTLQLAPEQLQRDVSWRPETLPRHHRPHYVFP